MVLLPSQACSAVARLQHGLKHALVSAVEFSSVEFISRATVTRIVSSTEETPSNLVLGLTCACGLPVHAITGEIEISGLSVPNLRHLETSQ